MKPDISGSKVVIHPGTWGDLTITFDGKFYRLLHSEIEWNIYNSLNDREVYEQYSSYDLSYGDVLLTGFGFGHIANWIASKPKVKSVTVLEISQEVLDAYLESNTLPEKVNVIIADANNYKTDKKYDCIILDHISNGVKPKHFYIDLVRSMKNIQHNLLWFWSIEFFYLKNYYNFTMKNLYRFPVDFNLFDFSEQWQVLRDDLGVDTIPNLEKSKLDSYINAYFLRHLIQE